MNHNKKITGKNKSISWKRRVSALIALILVFSTMVTMVFPETVGDDDGAIKAAPEIVFGAENAANGTEGEDGDEPVAPSGEEDPKEGENTRANMLDFIPPGTLTLIHKATGEAITEENPARPGEQVQLTVSIHEINVGNILQFNMDQMYLNIPAGIKKPDENITDTSTVQIKDTDQQIYDLPNTYTIGKNGVITYDWNHDHHEIRNGVDHDVYYMACHTADLSYSITLNLTVGTDADEIHFDDNHSYPVDRSVTLTVTKAISGVSGISPTQAQQMTFAVYDTDGNPVMKDGQPVTFTRAEMEGTIANASITISDLTADEYPAVFVVKETGHPEYEGFTFLTAGDGVVTQQTVEIPAGQSATANLKNRYSQDVSNLKIKKVFPSGSDKNFDNLTTAEKQKISFKVYGPNNDTVLLAEANLSETGKFNEDNEWILENISPGTYTVIETADLEGYTRTTTYKVDTNASVTGTSADVTLVKDGNHVVEFDNTYTEQRDKLKIKKTFAGAPLTDAEKANITFTITGPGGTQTVHYSDFDENGELILNDVLTGTYKVVESNVNPNTNNYTVTSTYSVNGDAPQSGTSANSVPVTVGGTNEVDFANTYAEIGKITLTKTIGGDYWGDFGSTYNNQQKRRNRIRAGVVYKLYKVENGERTEVQTITLTSFSGTNNATATYTINDLPVGTYEIDEIVSGTGSDGAIITNTIRTTTVTVNSGTTQTADPDATPVSSGSFSVTKGGTATVAYANNYNKKTGKIKLDKEVWIDGVKVTDWSTLTEAQQKAMKFTVTGRDVFNHSVSKVVTLYNILHPTEEGSPLNADGYLVLDYSNSSGYTVTESGADLSNYIRVTTRKLDGGEFGAGANISGVKINADNSEHTVTFKNEYTGTGRLKVDKTVTGLSAADETTVRGKIYFTIADTNGRPIIKQNGKYVLGEAGATAAQIPLSELTFTSTDGKTDGIELPVGTYILTEHNGELNTEYTWSVSNVVITDGQQIDPRQSAVSGNAAVTLGNTKHVEYTNTYTRNAIGPGGGVTIRKRVLLDGVEITADYTGTHRQLYNTVMANIRFKIYEGTEVNNANLIEGCPADGYTYQQLQANPPILFVGTYTIQETSYNVDHYTHTIYFTVNDVTTTTSDHVTITVTQNSPVNIDVYNGYIPLGDLEVRKVIDESGDLKAADLTAAQKSAIKFSVIGYNDTEHSEIIWPEHVFTYADMTPNADGVMSKVFNDIPIGIYVVQETDNDILNYNVFTVENPAGDGLEVHWNTSGTETAVKTFTNKYTRQKGNLEVTKTIDAPTTLTAAQRRAISFTVTGPDPSMPQTFTYAQMSGGKMTFENVITGTYTITETNADFDYFVRTTTVSVNGGDATTYSETSGVNASVVNDATATVRFTNEYKETGALIINKSFDDSECINKLTAAQKSNVEFTVWRVVEDGPNEVVRTITYDEILKWIQLHPSQDPAGYRFLVLPGEYIIEESNADFTSYVRTTTATVTVKKEAGTVSEDSVSATSVSATIGKFEEGNVVFTNKYNEFGKLKVKKTVEGLTYNDDQKNAVTFTVTQDNNVIATFTYAQILEQPGQEYVIDNLPAGTYTITETVTDEESVFYGNTRRTYVQVGTGGETEHSFGDVTVDKTDSDNIVAFRNKYDSATKLAVQKEIGGAPKVYIEKEDGKQYPVWKFNLHITNLNPSTTSNGTTYLIDTYDRDKFDLFKIVTDPADLAAIYAEDPEGEGKANILVPAGEGSAANVTLEPDYEDGEVAFKISGVTDDTAKINDLTYYLIPKDGDALEALNARDNTVPAGTPSNMLKKNFSNVVKYKELPLYSNYAETNWVTYQYEKTVVIKKCLNYNVERKHLVDEYGHDVNYALYEFIVNPEEMKLSTSGYIDVRDEFSENQSVSVESIKVERCVYDLEQNKVISTSPAQDGDVTYKDLHGFEIDLTLKDEICFRVTYTSTLLFTAAQADSPQELSNKVFVDGYYDGTDPVVIPSSQGTGNLYQVRLLKYQNGNLDNTLKGAQFKMYLDGDAAEAAKDSGDYSQAIATYETDKNGVIVITEYYINGVRYDISANSETPITYYFVESVAPAGYEKIDYVVQVRLAAPGETAHYGPDVWIYLPSDTVGIREYPFDTSVDLGALKTFETNGSERQLVEGEFSFRIRAKGNADIPMPEGTTDGEKIVANGADGKAVFGTIPYDTEDVVTRDNTGTVTSTTKTFVYEVSEVLPDGLDANGNKDGVHYDTNVYEVSVTVAVSNDNASLNVTKVTVDEKEVMADNNVYFAGLKNKYTAEGTWTPDIQKDLQGRPLTEGEFTFQIKNGEEVLATGTNNEDGTVTMDPERLTFGLDDLGANVLTIHEVYTIETGDGIYSVAEDVDVTVTVTEKADSEGNPVYDGTLNVTAEDSEGTLTAPIVMTNKFRASGSWNPKAEKTLTGVLKLNEGDFEFELAAVDDAPMPEGSTEGKLVVTCDADGKVDFGQIDFFQGTFDDVEYTDGDKEFHYTIREVIPDPEDRIFGVVYDDTVYNITVTTTINKTNKLGVAVTCDPEDGWDLDESTATFTGQFENTYGPTPAKAQPGYEKYLTGEIPTVDVTFEFKLEKAAGDNGDFDYVKVGDAPFTTQTKTLTLGPSSQTDSGLFDEITFLVEGTYKFKITETPNTNGALDPCFVYDSKEYTYTVVVTGVGENLQAAGAYSSADEDQTEQTAEIAVFTNKYTPAPTLFIPKAHKRMSGEPTVEDKTFTFTMTPDAANPDEGVYHDDTPFQGEDAEDTVVVVVPAGQTDAEELFSTMTFRKAGTYKFHVEEIIPATPIEDGITYDTVHWTLTIEVEDRSGQLTIISNEAKQDKDDGATDPDGMTTFTNHVPKTDDVSDMYLNAGMMLASGLLLLLIAVFGRKRKA